MTEDASVGFPRWMNHEETCTHAPGDPDHLAMVRARFGGGDTIELVTPLIPPGGSPSWALPVLGLWHRRMRQRIRRETTTRIGVPLAPLNLLVLTDEQLRLWQLTLKGRGQRRRYVVGDYLGHLDRSRILSVTDGSVGEGWRTCEFTLSDGTTVEVRVSARAVAGLVAGFSAT